MVVQVELPLPNLSIDPRIKQNSALLSSVISASGWIQQVFQDRTGDFDFAWEWSPSDPQGFQLHLNARSAGTQAQTRYRQVDLSDTLQMRRKLYELKGDLLSQETRKSLAELRDILNLSDEADVDVIAKE